MSEIEATPPLWLNHPPKPKANTAGISLNNSTLIKKTPGYTSTLRAAEASVTDMPTQCSIHRSACVWVLEIMCVLQLQGIFAAWWHRGRCSFLHGVSFSCRVKFGFKIRSAEVWDLVLTAWTWELDSGNYSSRWGSSHTADVCVSVHVSEWELTVGSTDGRCENKTVDSGSGQEHHLELWIISHSLYQQMELYYSLYDNGVNSIQDCDM